jgi:hypothetical protein
MHCIDAQCGWSCVGTSAEDCKTEWNRRNCTIPLAPEYREPTLEDAREVRRAFLETNDGQYAYDMLAAIRAGGFVVRADR